MQKFKVGDEVRIVSGVSNMFYSEGAEGVVTDAGNNVSKVKFYRGEYDDDYNSTWTVANLSMEMINQKEEEFVQEVKFKIGDKIRVAEKATSEKTQRILGEFENNWYAAGMDKFLGNVYTIRAIDSNGVRFEEDNTYGFPPAMLTLVSDEKEEMINFQVGQTVYCVLFGKGEIVKVGEDTEDLYNICVNYSNGANRYYTREGQYYENSNRALFFSKPKVEAAKQPLFVPQLKDGDMIVTQYDGFPSIQKVKQEQEDRIELYPTDGYEIVWFPKNEEGYQFWKLGEEIKF